MQKRSDNEINSSSETAGWRNKQADYNRSGTGYERKYSSRTGQSYHRRRCELLLNALSDAAKETQRVDILEIGCGTGMTLEFLGDKIASSIYGVDFSATMLGQAKAKFSNSDDQPSLLLGNAIQLPFGENSFDLIYATRFMHQFPHEDKLSIGREIERILRPGGLVYLEFYPRPINFLNYYIPVIDAHRYDSLEGHLIHYPSRKEIREIAGSSYRSKSLRCAGSRVCNRILGYKGFSLLNTIIGAVPVLNWLTTEEWVAFSPSRITEVDSSPVKDTSLPGYEKVRCPSCFGSLSISKEEEALECRGCHLSYAIVNDVPNLLPHEAKSLSSIDSPQD